MYSPVWGPMPVISGSPPVRSISLSDHIFAGLAFSFASTSAHSMSSCRFLFFMKRVFNTLMKALHFGLAIIFFSIFFFVIRYYSFVSKKLQVLCSRLTKIKQATDKKVFYFTSNCTTTSNPLLLIELFNAAKENISFCLIRLQIKAGGAPCSSRLNYSLSLLITRYK